MTSPSSVPRYRSFVLILIIQQLLGALTFPIAKLGLAEIEPFTFAFYRFVISGTILLSIARFGQNGRAITRQDGIKIIGLGLLIIPFNQVMYLYGQKLTGAGHGSLLFATTPIWIFLAAIFHLKERPTFRRIMGIAIALTGVFVIMTTGAVEISSDYLWGDLIILVAVLAWAYYTIYGKPLVEKYGALRVTAYALASGTAFYFPFGLYRAIIFDYSATTMTGWLSVCYVAIGTSVLAYVLWYWVIKYLPASRVAVYHNLQPLFATVVAALWLGEEIGLSFVVGGLVVLGGVILAEI